MLFTLWSLRTFPRLSSSANLENAMATHCPGRSDCACGQKLSHPLLPFALTQEGPTWRSQPFLAGQTTEGPWDWCLLYRPQGSGFSFIDLKGLVRSSCPGLVRRRRGRGTVRGRFGGVFSEGAKDEEYQHQRLHFLKKKKLFPVFSLMFSGFFDLKSCEELSLRPFDPFEKLPPPISVFAIAGGAHQLRHVR